MSDQLRISGQAAPGFGSGQSGQRRSGNLARFKQGRKPGDLVHGTFLRLEEAAPGTAWVNLEGEDLLAALPEDLADLARRIFSGRGVGAQPSGLSEANFPLRAGSPCYFVLEALEPEPRLRMLGLQPGQAGQKGWIGSDESQSAAALAWSLAREQARSLWRALADLPPAVLAARYATARSALDAQLQERCWPSLPEETAKVPQLCHAAYQRFLLNDGEALAGYAELALCRAALVRVLRPLSLRDLRFVPWLYPQATGLDLARLGEFFVLHARLPQAGGQLELRGKLGPNGEWQTLSQKIMPPGQGDLLAFLLALRPLGGGFSRRT